VSDPAAISEADVVTPLGSIDGDMVPIKGGCDLALLGHALTPGARPVKRSSIELEIGAFKRRLVVSGDRIWQRDGQTLVASEPQFFSSMPLTYEHAFGGTSSCGDFETAHADNPGGKGFMHPGESIEGVSLPNIEEVDQLLQSPTDLPLLAGLAPLPRNCAMRLARGALVDLEEGTSRLLPQMFSMAHPRMILDSYPAGQELRLRGMTLADTWRFRLPELALGLDVMLGPHTHHLPMNVDTICVFPDHRRFYLVARRAFIYQFEPREQRHVRLSFAVPSRSAEPGSFRQLAPALAARFAALDPAYDALLPFELLRELNPMTEILEGLPLCLSA
jgi:hypothetical protein